MSFYLYTGHSNSGHGPIFFYDRNDPYYEFTNFAYYPIVINGIRFPTSEHYFQSQKLIGTPFLHKVCELPCPRQAFEYPRQPHVSVWVRQDWQSIKDDVMYRALIAKFTQHPYLKNKLLETGDRMLVEHLPYDSYWGDGGDGKGLNRLGELLMKLRAVLRGEGKKLGWREEQDKHRPTAQSSSNMYTNPTSGDQYTNPTSGDQYTNPTSGDQYTNPTSGDQHTNPTSGDQHTNPTSGDQYTNPTSGDQYTNPTSGDRYTNHPTSGDQYTNPTSGDRYTNPTSGDRYTNPTSGDRYTNPTSGDRYTNPTSGDRYTNPTSGDRYTNPTSGDRYTNPTSGDRYTNPTSGERYSNPTSGDRYVDTISADRYTDTTSADRCTDTTSVDRYADTTSVDRYADTTSADRYTNTTGGDPDLSRVSDFKPNLITNQAVALCSSQTAHVQPKLPSVEHLSKTNTDPQPCFVSSSTSTSSQSQDTTSSPSQLITPHTARDPENSSTDEEEPMDVD